MLNKVEQQMVDDESMEMVLWFFKQKYVRWEDAKKMADKVCLEILMVGPVRFAANDAFKNHYAAMRIKIKELQQPTIKKSKIMVKP